MVKPFLVQRDDNLMHLSWNLAAKVGLNSPNKIGDVELVQLGYVVMAKRQAGKLTPELKKMMSELKIGQVCTGRQDDPLVRVIIEHQKLRKSMVDGHVSVIRNSSGNINGVEPYLLGALMNNIWADQEGDFPRVDKHPRCGTNLRK